MAKIHSPWDDNDDEKGPWGDNDIISPKVKQFKPKKILKQSLSGGGVY